MCDTTEATSGLAFGRNIKVLSTLTELCLRQYHGPFVRLRCDTPEPDPPSLTSLDESLSLAVSSAPSCAALCIPTPRVVSHAGNSTACSAMPAYSTGPEHQPTTTHCLASRLAKVHANAGFTVRNVEQQRGQKQQHSIGVAYDAHSAQLRFSVVIYVCVSGWQCLHQACAAIPRNCNNGVRTKCLLVPDCSLARLMLME